MMWTLYRRIAAVGTPNSRQGEILFLLVVTGKLKIGTRLDGRGFA
ncbi:MAG: hypothetical protein ABF379_13615 [Akkermansiaceae bacterium]